MLELRDILHQPVLNGRSEDPDHQHQNNQESENQSIKDAKQPQNQVITPFFNIIDRIQTYDNGISSLGGGPESSDNGYDRNGSVRLCVDLTNDPPNKRAVLETQGPLYHYNQIFHGKIMNVPGQGKKENHKGEERKNRKESRHGTKGAHMIVHTLADKIPYGLAQDLECCLFLHPAPSIFQKRKLSSF
jgi:hypothetical protein